MKSRCSADGDEVGVRLIAEDRDLPMTHGAQAAHDKFPMRFLAAAILLNCLVVIWLGWNAYHSYRAARILRERDFRIQQLQGTILQFDEVLTMSARMAAATGDLSWEQRYRKCEPQLAAAIREVIGLEPLAYQGKGAARTEAANTRLVELEHRAFGFVRQGLRAQAHNVLSSKEYAVQKRIYSDGMAEVAAQLRKKTDESLEEEHRRTVADIVAAAISLPTLLIGWYVVLRLVHLWRTRITERTAELYAHQGLLREARDVAEQASRAKSEFLAHMRHEIRTPLNGIAGMTALALSSQPNPEQREYLEAIKDSTDSLLVVINDILDFSRIEADTLELEATRFSLRQTLEVATSVIGGAAREKGIQLAWRTADATPDKLIGDPRRLRQILLHLVGNAVKFTESGEVILEVEEDPGTGEEVRLQFRVRDTGIGIAADKLDVIFEAFSQADNSNTRQYGGTGLGLTIASRLVALMGGRLWVQSTPGEGSIFHFTARFGRGKMPEGSAVPAGASSQHEPIVGPSSVHEPPGVRILLAEDNPINQKVALHLLTRHGHQVSVAANGQEALRAIENEPQGGFDLILMDVQMPVMDGLAATEAIREREKGIGSRVPIVAMTAQAAEDDRERFVAAGMDDYISKPIHVESLLNLIERLTRASAGKS